MSSSYLHRCGKRVPNSAYHCGGCHETFIGLGAFDRHRKRGACIIEPVSKDPFVDSGFWVDGDGYWHSGKRMTAEEIEERFGK